MRGEGGGEKRLRQREGGVCIVRCGRSKLLEVQKKTARYRRIGGERVVLVQGVDKLTQGPQVLTRPDASTRFLQVRLGVGRRLHEALFVTWVAHEKREELFFSLDAMPHVSAQRFFALGNNGTVSGEENILARHTRRGCATHAQWRGLACLKERETSLQAIHIQHEVFKDGRSFAQYIVGCQ